MIVLWFIIGIFAGLVIGIIIMSLFNASTRSDYLSVVRLLNGALEKEMELAVAEQKSKSYILGMKRVIKFVKYYFKEEIHECKQDDKK
jgi:hypothetical protein